MAPWLLSGMSPELQWYCWNVSVFSVLDVGRRAFYSSKQEELLNLLIKLSRIPEPFSARRCICSRSIFLVTWRSSVSWSFNNPSVQSKAPKTELFYIKTSKQVKPSGEAEPRFLRITSPPSLRNETLCDISPQTETRDCNLIWILLEFPKLHVGSYFGFSASEINTK